MEGYIKISDLKAKLTSMKKFSDEHYNEMAISGADTVFESLKGWISERQKETETNNQAETKPLIIADVSKSLPKTSYFQAYSKAKDLTLPGFKVWWYRNILGYDC